jgi:hypothetical protein
LKHTIPLVTSVTPSDDVPPFDPDLDDVVDLDARRSHRLSPGLIHNPGTICCPRPTRANGCWSTRATSTLIALP